MAIQDAEYKHWILFVSREMHIKPNWDITTIWLKCPGRQNKKQT